MDRYRAIAVVISCLLLLAQTGCAQKEPIESYSVEKPHRFLAAIIPQGDHFWLFRLSGPSAELRPEAPLFRQMIESIHFSDDEAPPVWVLPKDWRKMSSDEGRFELRHATLQLGPEQQPFELSVMKWELDDPTKKDALLLKRVNRWRRQMSLPALDHSELKQLGVKLPGKDIEVTLIDLQGTLPPDGLSYVTPEGWIPSAGNAFSMLAFESNDLSQDWETTISPLSRGSILDNVNRWRRQILLPPTTAEQLVSGSSRLGVDDAMGTYVQLDGRQASILGVIVIRGDKMWFIKWMGSEQQAKLQREPFEAFVKSIEFVP